MLKLFILLFSFSVFSQDIKAKLEAIDLGNGEIVVRAIYENISGGDIDLAGSNIRLYYNSKSAALLHSKENPPKSSLKGYYVNERFQKFENQSMEDHKNLDFKDDFGFLNYSINLASHKETKKLENGSSTVVSQFKMKKKDLKGDLEISWGRESLTEDLATAYTTIHKSVKGADKDLEEKLNVEFEDLKISFKDKESRLLGIAQDVNTLNIIFKGDDINDLPIKVFDSLGREVHSAVVNKDDRLDFSSKSSGTYVIHAKGYKPVKFVNAK